MDYHKDRFHDYSLMVFKEDKLCAVLPANISENIVFSHQGLSYGGLLLGEKLTFFDSYSIFKSVLLYLAQQDILKLQLKVLPRIYTTQLSDEVDFLMFKLKAKNIKRDLTSVIISSNKLPIESSNRKRRIKKAIKNKLLVKETNDFKDFWEDILVPNLQETHNVKPIHALNEITFLKSKFPKNIKQFNVYNEKVIIAGVTIFETKTVAHIQYISSNSSGKNLGALDFLIHYLINEKYNDKNYFDFGISNENQGKNINKGLLSWKESFGARSVVHDFYEIETSNHVLLNDLFI